jgi:hypothetical protein
MLAHDPREDLDRVQKQVVTGVCRVVEQRARMERLRLAGLPIQPSELLLRLLEETLALLLYRRRSLEPKIATAAWRGKCMHLETNVTVPWRHISGSHDEVERCKSRLG